MRFDVITLFPEMFQALTQYGITSRAWQQGLWTLRCWNPRDYTQDVHHTVDDRPYGGGPGMVMLAKPLHDAWKDIQTQIPSQRRTILLSPCGKPFVQADAQRLLEESGAIFVCGRYEGIDQRFIDLCVDEEYSLGDFVLSGGELACMAFMDASVRLIPQAMNSEASYKQDSFQEELSGLLDSPHYTRPVDFEGMTVPQVLMSGNHALIEQWRRQESLKLTFERRPELLEQAAHRLSDKDLAFLKTLHSSDF
ncbi:tRNA (guanosine(37)-N1)-methyltransferase TrmD [Basilea psittacipulmonis]|uniref:tRNA (guanine-N(1)-)-methyltransferase n=1 Tax=Basilea psittacipulmonis DSM 24701 TaxID=1072685 RepID=A0A077DCT4_9BURK|nr:tRNA (guanosine(37)-N1)-methyltransferase TrmD [Basilea psittacipulmonis]AIL32695.1 tRNA (guanine-N1)-methyltransferase [Basilea psittacipulmonis DSM 24701]